MRDDGKRIQTQEELAVIFQKFLLKKFAKTEKEELRAELDALSEQDGVGEMTRKEFEATVKRMKPGKATGKDGIADEVWKIPKWPKTCYSHSWSYLEKGINPARSSGLHIHNDI